MESAGKDCAGGMRAKSGAYSYIPACGNIMSAFPAGAACQEFSVVPFSL